MIYQFPLYSFLSLQFTAVQSIILSRPQVGSSREKVTRWWTWTWWLPWPSWGLARTTSCSPAPPSPPPSWSRSVPPRRTGSSLTTTGARSSRSVERLSHSDCDQLLPCRPGVLRDSTHWRTRAPHITAEFYYQLSELSSVDLPRPQYSCIYTGFYVNKYRNREILLNNTRYRQNLRYEILRLVTAPILIWKYDEYEIRLRL